ncbi:MAG: hypothetical protein ACFE9A_09880, partial [Candidatus Hodarchaeota archaeon]
TYYLHVDRLKWEISPKVLCYEIWIFVLVLNVFGLMNSCKFFHSYYISVSQGLAYLTASSSTSL